MPLPSVTGLDPASDANYEELARLVKVYEFPEFVKKADLDETTKPSFGAAVSIYADPPHKRYPCHSAAATWLSAVYFQEKRAEFHPKIQQQIQQRLERYVDYFRIRPAYEQMLKQAQELHRESSLPDSSYAYVWVDEQGAKSRYLPMRSAMETKVAGDWLSTYADRLPFVDRHTIAIKILEKAASYGAGLGQELTEFLEKQAGMGVCDPTEVYEMIMHRALLASNQQQKAQIIKLAELVKDQPRIALQPDQLVKLAAAMDTTDQVLGLAGQYGEMLRRPEDVIFKVTFTKAAADRAELCALTTGNVYSHAQFEKLSREDVSSLFGDDFASEVCDGFKVDGEKMAAVAHTLPRPDAVSLDGMMNEFGLQPQMQKHASSDKGLSNNDLEALAAAYIR